MTAMTAEQDGFCLLPAIEMTMDETLTISAPGAEIMRWPVAGHVKMSIEGTEALVACNAIHGRPASNFSLTFVANVKRVIRYRSPSRR